MMSKSVNAISRIVEKRREDKEGIRRGMELDCSMDSKQKHGVNRKGSEGA